MDPQENKTVYVGNLDPSVTDELIVALFSQIGPVKGCKIIRDAVSAPPGAAAPAAAADPYCFVEFASHAAAATALTAMNKRWFLDREIKVNWAASSTPTHPHQSNGPASSTPPSGSTPVGRVDTSAHHHIFVGDLSAEIESDQLRQAFAVFGEISDCKVVKDMVYNKSKGYGFVSFVKKADAQKAIEQMNGQYLGSRAIRTNWATRKPPGPGGGGAVRHENGMMGKEHKPLNFEEVFAKASNMNFTVYCGGLLNGDDNLIRRTFSPFGRILEIRYFKDKGYAFVRYDNKESACNAIVALNGTEVNGNIVKCSWGKENGGNAAVQGMAAALDPNAYLLQQHQQPQYMTQEAAAALVAQQQQYYQQYYLYNPMAAAAAAAQMQQQQQQQQQFNRFPIQTAAYYPAGYDQRAAQPQFQQPQQQPQQQQ